MKLRTAKTKNGRLDRQTKTGKKVRSKIKREEIKKEDVRKEGSYGRSEKRELK